MAGEQFSLSLTDLASLSNETTFLSQINANFQTLEDALNNMYVTPFNPTSGAASAVVDDLDMNSNRIINLPSATTNTEPVTYAQFLAGTTASGNAILNGSGAPSDVDDGNNGDFYIDTTAWDVYGPKASGAWPAGVSLVGPTGSSGANGADGSTVLSGSGAPTTEGNDGDFYIDTDNLNVYGPKASGSWPLAATRIVTGSSRGYSSLALGLAQALTTATVTPIEWDTLVDESTWQPADGGSSQRFWLGANFNFTATNATNMLTKTSHGFTTGEGPIRLTNSGGALPTGLATGTDYWVIVSNANDFQVATSRANAIAGTAVTFSDDGTGTHSTDTEDWFVIPTGVTGAILSATCRFAANATGNRYLEIFLEGGQTIDGTNYRRVQDEAAGSSVAQGMYVSTGPLVVTAGERYGVNMFQTSGGNLDAEAGMCNFQILVTEPLGGRDGNTVLNGSGAPSDATVGDNGDFYIDTTAVTIYGPKTSGVWGSSTSLQGGTATAELSTYVAASSGDLGPIIGKGDDSGTNETDYFTITPVAVTGTDTAEDGRADISAMKAGTSTDAVSIGALTASKFGAGLGASGNFYKDIGGTFYQAKLPYLISSQTASASSALTFTDIPSSGVEMSIFRFLQLEPSVDDRELHFRFTNSGVADSSTVYRNVSWQGTSAEGHNAHGANAQEDHGYIGMESAGQSVGNSTDEYIWGEICIVDPNNATDYKWFWGRGVWRSASIDRTVVYTLGGVYESASAIDGISIYFESGNIDSGTIEHRVYM